jgi:pimeloyl-ACP methyl ester carboxylesterase
MKAMSGEQRTASGENWRARYPFQSHWLDLPAGRLHYLDEFQDDTRGDRETLLFVHGNPTWTFHWRNLIQALRPRYRCVAIDHIGCGLSDKPQRLFSLEERTDDLATLVERLDLQHITLVAQDWGGSIGLGAMLRRPERLERMVLFNTGAFPPPYIPLRIRACRWPVVGQLGVQGGNLFSRAALRMTLARESRLDPAIAAAYLAPYDSWANRRAVYGFVKDIPTSSRDATWQTLADIERQLPTLADRPALLVWGMRDWCFRPDCLARFEAAWPDAEVHRLTDVGHWVLEDAAEEAGRIVDQFLASTTAKGNSSCTTECTEVTEKL